MILMVLVIMICCMFIVVEDLGAGFGFGLPGWGTSGAFESYVYILYITYIQRGRHIYIHIYIYVVQERMVRRCDSADLLLELKVAPGIPTSIIPLAQVLKQSWVIPSKLQSLHGRSHHMEDSGTSSSLGQELEPGRELKQPAQNPKLQNPPKTRTQTKCN